MSQRLYEHPLYYDIAFSWDLTPEIVFLGRVFREHVPFAVRDVLEPCCGTGRFLVELPKHGYSVTGYDRNPTMLEFARKRVAGVGDPVVARALRGDMISVRFDREFDAALNSINSLGYLLTDEDIVRHFANTAVSLRVGGVYVVHIACAWEEEPKLDGNTWTMVRDGVRVRTTWTVERQDRVAKLSHQLCVMEIEEEGRTLTLFDRHVLRLWTYDDFRELVARSGRLTLAAVYSEDFERLPLDAEITGQMGNLYYVLRAG